MEPTPPSRYVLPKPTHVSFSLIKPASTHAKAAKTLPGGPQFPAWVETITEKIKTNRDATNKALAPMQAQIERPQDRVQLDYGPAQLPAAFGQYDHVIHETHIAYQLTSALARQRSTDVPRGLREGTTTASKIATRTSLSCRAGCGFSGAW